MSQLESNLYEQHSMSSSGLPLEKMLPRIPAPARRHASPAGPWPWQDLDYEQGGSSPTSLRVPNPSQTVRCPHRKGECDGFNCWSKYPQSLFSNWTPDQVRRSRIMELYSESCTLHVVDVGEDGAFSNVMKYVVSDGNEQEQASLMRQKRPANTRFRALFMDHLSTSVMQILGTKYKIEPFYFSSSVNWIPSLYQEAVTPKEGDHITITLSFIRATRSRRLLSKPSPNFYGDRTGDQHCLFLLNSDPSRRYDQSLVLEMLALHMVRAKDSTIISYHAPQSTTSAEQLHNRVALAGSSVYWKNVFEKSKDPTIILLTILWFGIYAWDESLAMLWDHIGRLEINVLKTHDVSFTQELHKIQAHLLFYESLLRDFKNTILFLRDTPNPTMDSLSQKERKESRKTFLAECRNLSVEIDRLEMTRKMENDRLKNVMELAFSSVNADDSKHMARLSEQSLKDSAAMKQISYLTMVFLPASFSAALFGMNVSEITSQSNGSLWVYIVTAIGLTVITIWIMVAWHTPAGEENPTSLARLCWPFLPLVRWAERKWTARLPRYRK